MSGFVPIPTPVSQGEVPCPLCEQPMGARCIHPYPPGVVNERGVGSIEKHFCEVPHHAERVLLAEQASRAYFRLQNEAARRGERVDVDLILAEREPAPRSKQ